VAGGNISLKAVLNANLVYNFRRDVGDLKPLIKSIRNDGQMYPVILDGNYFIIDGARRIEALKKMHATTVWAVSSNDWDTIAKHLADVGKRHAHEAFLPKSFIDLAYLLNYLGARSRDAANMRNIGVPRSVRKARGRQDREDLHPLLSKGIVYYMEQNLPGGAIQAIGRIGSRIDQQRMLGNTENIKKIEAMLAGFSHDNRKGLYTLINQIDEMLDPELKKQRESRTPKPPVAQQSITAQGKSIDRSLVMLQGIVAALPAAPAVSAEHSAEEVEKWQKELTKITVPLRRLNARLTEIQRERS
jgi:hypothetical protein